MQMAQEVANLPTGPQPGVTYPIRVQYCGECTLPVEYCEYGPCPDKCKEWLRKNLHELYETLHVSSADGADASSKKDSEGAEGVSAEDKKRQKRGGKGAPKAPKKAAAVDQKISVSRAPRGKNKFVTVVSGLQTYDIDLKAAAKFFAQKFACGSSVTGPDEIVIQGDVKDDLFDVLPEKWSQIDEDNIDDLGDLKR